MDKSRILYKGDIYAAYFYIFMGLFLMISALGMLKFTTTLGFYYLSIGFILLCLYCLGKGSFMIYLYGGKYSFFKNNPLKNKTIVVEELSFTEYRINKKNINRRRYVYIIVLGSIISFAGMFLPQKSMIMGTAIPITLIAAVEFSIGLLTEFRLREYERYLRRIE